MERFVTFDAYNSFHDWHLILTSKTLTPPKPKTHTVNIDGMDGVVDLTQTLTGGVTYDNRTMSLSFLTDKGDYVFRQKLINTITNTLHGQKLKVVEPDNPDYYFSGRAVISNISNSLSHLTFQVDVDCDPYMYAINPTNRLFNLSGKTIKTVLTNNALKTLCPMFTIKGFVNISYNGYKLLLSTGTYKSNDIKLYQGNNLITLSGNGSITFNYREGRL